MDLVTRAKNICLTPATEWPVIAEEPATTSGLIANYAAPLAAIGAIAGFIGTTIVGTSVPFLGTYRIPLVTGVVMAIFGFGMALVSAFVLSLIIDALAPTFNAQKSQIQALKLAVYSFTPAWIAGVLRIFPILGILGLFAALYAVYLLYLGIPRLMKAPAEKAVPYTVVVFVCAIVLTLIMGAIGGLFVGAGLGAGGLSSARATSSDVQFDKNSPMGKLQQLAKTAEEGNKKMEAAAKSGDPNAQAAAAVESLGALLGGGKRVDPVDIEQLKPLVPETFNGLPKTSSKAEVSGIMALAGWAGVEGVSEDDRGSERTQKVNGRLVHEKTSKTGGSNEYAVVVADRFVVSAKGKGVDVGTLKAAVSAIDLGKLESMKTVGVKQ